MDIASGLPWSDRAWLFTMTIGGGTLGLKATPRGFYDFSGNAARDKLAAVASDLVLLGRRLLAGYACVKKDAAYVKWLKCL
jgi:hypothetical protein